MALPRIYQKLFQNEGAGSILRSDILPPAQSVAVADVTINNYNTAGEYIITGDKTAAEGYPYDTSDPVYLKVIAAGDSVIQYFIHNDDIQIRYKGSDGKWSEWKSYEALIEAGDNELASQIQQLKVNANTLLGKITVVESSVASLESSVGEHTSDIAALKTTTSTNTANIATLKTDVSANASDISTLGTRTTTAEGEIDTLQSDLASLTSRVSTNEGSIATNTANIQTSADDITALKTDVAANTTNISTNTTNLSAAVTRIDDVTNWESTAQMHNNIYRGANLLDGHFGTISDFISAVSAGDFSDIYLGDYVTATYDGTNTTKYRVAAINLLNARSGSWGTTKPNVCIVPDGCGTSYMNSTNTAVGAYVSSYMYTTKLPALYKTIGGNSGSPFYGHVLSTTETFANATSTSMHSTAYSGYTFAESGWVEYATTLCLMSPVEIFGDRGWGTSQAAQQSIAVQLPMFAINPASITLNGTIWFWTRAVAASGGFCCASDGLHSYWNSASGAHVVRPRFFIG